MNLWAVWNFLIVVTNHWEMIRVSVMVPKPTINWLFSQWSEFFLIDYYDDDVKPQNKTGQGSSPKKMWDRPLRDHEIKVLRKSKVLKQSHKPSSSEHFSHKGNRSHLQNKHTKVHAKGEKRKHSWTLQFFCYLVVQFSFKSLMRFSYWKPRGKWKGNILLKKRRILQYQRWYKCPPAILDVETDRELGEWGEWQIGAFKMAAVKKVPLSPSELR